MDLATLALLLLDSLFYMSLIFLIVAGLNIIYGVMRIVNLAHASLFALGAYVTAWLTASYIAALGAGLLALLALPLLAAAIASVIAAAALVTPVLRYSYGKGDSVQLIMTFGLLLIFEELFQVIWGRQPLSANDALFAMGSLHVLGLAYPAYKIYVICLTVALGAALWLFIYRTSFGMLLRAVSMDREMAQALGADVSRIIIVAIIISSLLAGIGGALYLPSASIAPGLSLDVLIVAFIGLVIGGPGSFVGSFIGALIVSVFRTISIYTVPELELIILFAVAFLVLIFKPEGIGGGRG